MPKIIISASPLPWHASLWKRWYALFQSKQLPHALLLQGTTQSGKTTFLKALSQLILCHRPIYQAKTQLYQSCRTCTACLWYSAGTHPNYYPITPANTEQNGSIVIDQIRELTDKLQQTAISGDSAPIPNIHTVVLIDSANKLQLSAQHALLKTLEEPMPGVLFLLASDAKRSLLPTIQSRCQCVGLPQPSHAQAVSWVQSNLSGKVKHNDDQMIQLGLILSNNTPSQVCHYLENNEIAVYQSIVTGLLQLRLNQVYPSEVVEMWNTHPIQTVISYLMQAVSAFVQLKLNHSHMDARVIHISSHNIHQMINITSIKDLFCYWDRLNSIQEDIRTYNLNPVITLETLAYQFSNSRNFS